MMRLQFVVLKNNKRIESIIKTGLIDQSQGQLYFNKEYTHSILSDRQHHRQLEVLRLYILNHQFYLIPFQLLTYTLPEESMVLRVSLLCVSSKNKYKYIVIRVISKP